MAAAATTPARFLRHASHRTHLIFGANTDVGKTLTSAGLVRASLMQNATDTVHYIKPLQCGGSDEGFIEKHCTNNIINTTNTTTTSSTLQCQTLFSWETPASPHIASRQENIPKSDQEVLGTLDAALVDIVASSHPSSTTTTTWIETAGGVLSPSSASPDNQSRYHASSSASDNSNGSWGWLTQGDLYKPLSESTSVVLCGDGRLGGKNESLSLWTRRIFLPSTQCGSVLLLTF